MSLRHQHDKTDEELIMLFQQSSDMQYLGVLLERHTLLLLGIAMKYLKDKQLAEDAVQQVFVKTISNFPMQPIQNFKGWLYILMRNHCLSSLRNHTYILGEEQLQYLSAPETKSTQDWLHDEQLHKILLQEMHKLSAEQQKCIRMFYIDQCSYKEIMQQLGYTFEQVKSYVQNGRRMLRIAVEKNLPQKEK